MERINYVEPEAYDAGLSALARADDLRKQSKREGLTLAEKLALRKAANEAEDAAYRAFGLQTPRA